MLIKKSETKLASMDLVMFFYSGGKVLTKPYTENTEEGGNDGKQGPVPPRKEALNKTSNNHDSV